MYREERRTAKIYIISLAAGIETRASSCTERRGGLPRYTSSPWQQVLRPEPVHVQTGEEDCQAVHHLLGSRY
jgi:hypothetical protein